MVKNWYDFIYERFDIKSNFNNIVLLLNNDKNIFLLYDIKINKPIGYISYWYEKSINCYPISGIYSKNGYGPFLYETVMTYVYPNGISMSLDTETSDDAILVYRKFYEREDVKKIKMNNIIETHKKQIFNTNNKYSGSYKNDGLELEDIKFIYTYGKDKLDDLLKRGNQYIIDNNINDDDFYNMIDYIEKKINI